MADQLTNKEIMRLLQLSRVVKDLEISKIQVEDATVELDHEEYTQGSLDMLFDLNDPTETGGLKEE